MNVKKSECLIDILCDSASSGLFVKVQAQLSLRLYFWNSLFFSSSYLVERVYKVLRIASQTAHK